MESIKKVKVQYCDNTYELFCSLTDSRTNLVESRKGTQEGKVCTWRDIVSNLNSQRVFDIGSNYGEFLIPIANFKKHIYAFEPVQDVYNCLVKSIDNLNFDTNHITIIKAAIGDTTQMNVLNVPESSGNASLDINCVKYKNTVKTENVEEHDILYYLEECSNFVMKIDVEGLEYKILRRIMENDNFDWYCIMFEFNRFNQNDNNVIEDFLHKKQVMGIGNYKLELKDENFFTYEKGKSWGKLKDAHDVIVCKNINWNK